MALNLSSVVSMDGKHYDYIYCVEACYFDKTRKHYYTSIQDVKRYFNRYKDSDNLIFINFYKYDVAKIIDVDFKENLAFLLFKAEQKQIDAFVTGYNHYGWTKGDLSSLEEVEQVEVEQVEVEQKPTKEEHEPAKENTIKNNDVIKDIFVVNDENIYDNIEEGIKQMNKSNPLFNKSYKLSGVNSFNNAIMARYLAPSIYEELQLKTVIRCTLDAEPMAYYSKLLNACLLITIVPLNKIERVKLQNGDDAALVRIKSIGRI